MAKILIVDDEPQVVRLLSIVLSRVGYKIQTASNAYEAFAERSSTFDLILSDVDMPGMDGHDLARWLAARDPPVRVMLMSAYASHCDDCPYSPRCHLLRKPFAPGEVVKMVAAALAS